MSFDFSHMSNAELESHLGELHKARADVEGSMDLANLTLQASAGDPALEANARQGIQMLHDALRIVDLETAAAKAELARRR
jgi:hypothetical protein